MTVYDEWSAKAHEGRCANCNADVLVFTYPRNPAAPYPHIKTMDLCFLCSNVAGANAQEYPDQHPHHNSIVGPILGAMSLSLSVLRPPKRPKKKSSKPRKPKGALAVMPMQPLAGKRTR